MQTRFIMLALAGSATTVSFALAGQIRITEYMYSGSGAGGEFIELTNVGATPVDMTGWSFDDVNRVIGTFDLSGFGVVQPGESVIITEDRAHVFRADWNLPADVKIAGDLGRPAGNQLGRNDEINLWNGGGTLVDRLTFGDQAFPGSIRAQNRSGWSGAAGIGVNDPYAWVLSTAGDDQDSVTSSLGAIGSPGGFALIGPPAGPLPIIAITEYMYTGPGGEFVEFTNVSDAPVDMTGWSYDNSAREVGAFDLSAFGTVQPGESVILTQTDAEAFRADWGLGAGVKIIGDLGATTANNIGRNDELNIWDHAGELVDRLTYGDQDFPGSIRTQGVSGWISPEDLGLNNPYAYTFSAVGDMLDSYVSAQGDIGNPGVYFTQPAIDGDLNRDGSVDLQDLLILLAGWGPCPESTRCPADIDGDGTVGLGDLLVLLSNWS